MREQLTHLCINLLAPVPLSLARDNSFACRSFSPHREATLPIACEMNVRLLALVYFRCLRERCFRISRRANECWSSRGGSASSGVGGAFAGARYGQPQHSPVAWQGASVVELSGFLPRCWICGGGCWLGNGGAGVKSASGRPLGLLRIIKDYPGEKSPYVIGIARFFRNSLWLLRR